MSVREKQRAVAQTASKPPTLAELQSRFQEAVMAGDDAVLALIPDNSRTNHTVLLGVYRHAYVARLVEIVANDHSVLSRFMGEDAFREMARAYVKAYPSRNQNARWFPHRLPEFLGVSAVYGGQRALADIASLERAVNDAFDAADAPVLDMPKLAKHAPERWGDLFFTPHPSAARLDLHTNAFAIWKAVKNDNDAPPVDALAERERILVWRDGTMPKVRALAAEEVMMWDEAAKGVRFSVLCEMAATFDDPDTAALRVAQYLQAWIGAGLLSKAGLRRKPPQIKA
ncbi:MAG TPA: DNA-binding domain-containing protein [Methylocystis sp.]